MQFIKRERQTSIPKPVDPVRVTSRTGLTVLELLVTMGIIGVLVSIVLPAVQHIRETARRIQCQNNLHQLAITMHQHHDTFGHLPAGWTEIPGRSEAFGWVPELLPFLEQTGLQASVCSEWPRSALSASTLGIPLIQTPAVLMCPSDVAASSFRLYAESHHHSAMPQDPLSDVFLMELPHANYVGMYGTIDPDKPHMGNGDGTFIRGRPLSWRDLTNGLSNVAVAGERTARRLPSTWLGFHVLGEDGAGRVAAFSFYGPNHPLADECELDSRHPGGINVAFADGHVKFIGNSVDVMVYRQMAKRSQ